MSASLSEMKRPLRLEGAVPAMYDGAPCMANPTPTPAKHKLKDQSDFITVCQPVKTERIGQLPEMTEINIPDPEQLLDSELQ